MIETLDLIDRNIASHEVRFMVTTKFKRGEKNCDDSWSMNLFNGF